MDSSLDKAAKGLARVFERRKRVEMTREGKFFAAMAVALGVVAVNTGINLLYLVLAAILASIVVSGVASEICIRGIDVRRSAPRSAVCGELATVRLKVSNGKRLFPSAAIYFEDSISSKRADIRVKCFAPKIDPRGEIDLAYNVKFERRGLYDFGPLTISTQSPFGLFKKSLRLHKSDQTIVLPKPSTLDSRFLTRLAGLVEAYGPKKHLLAGQGDFRSLREFRQGDNIKLIHWRTSAKFSKLMLRELEREKGSCFAILLNAVSPDGVSSDDEEAFERCVSAAASLAGNLIRAGHAVSYIPLGRAGDHLGLGSSYDHLRGLMERLALVELVGSGSLERAADEACGLVPAGSIGLALGFEKEQRLLERIISKLAARRVRLERVAA